jgi:hypothetical protein
LAKSQKSRGVAAESTEFRDRKEIEAHIKTTPHPLRVLVELGHLVTTYG